MVTQADLLLAILALDAYNRGCKPGMALPNSDAPGTQILSRDEGKLSGSLLLGYFV